MLAEVSSFLNRKGERDFLVSGIRIVAVEATYGTMTQTLNSLCLQGRFVLISHSVAEGDFLVHHFLSQALKGFKNQVNWNERHC